MLRWFPLLVLIRPVIDSLFFLKSYSPLLSPPYWAGVLTPVFCLIAILKYRAPQATQADRLMEIWAGLLAFVCLILLIKDPLQLVAIEFILKLSLPVFLYFFLRRFIRRSADFEGLLFTVWLSCIPVALVLISELLMGPFSVQESRGLLRYQGSFGDVVSYGIYISLALLASLYFFERNKDIWTTKKRNALLLVTFVLSVMGLVNIHHTASYAVAAALIVLAVVWRGRQSVSSALSLVVVVGGLGFATFDALSESVVPLVVNDIEVYQGEGETSKLLHGRVGRWQAMLAQFAHLPVWAQVLGYPLSLETAYAYIGSGAHNDWVRLLFLNGFFGLLIFLLIQFTLVRHALNFKALHVRMALLSVWMVWMLYSVSTTPTLYAPFLYLLAAALALVALYREPQFHESQ